MDQGPVLDITRQGIQVAIMVGMPILAVSLFLGVLVSVLQAITQVQEMTLTFVPKLIGVALVIVLMGSWMLSMLVTFTHQCFDQMARIGGL